MLLIGGRALRVHLPAHAREPVDHDYICTYDEYRQFVRNHRDNGYKLATRTLSDRRAVVFLEGGSIYEFEFAWPGSSAERILRIEEGAKTASLMTLLLLKMSHRYLRNSPHFHKTRDDILAIRRAGVYLPTGSGSVWADILKQREAETYTYKHPNLKQGKAQFFDDSVPYQYDHDSIHEAVKLGIVPAYKLFAKDGEEVKSDRRKFEALPLDKQLAAGYEESCVLALERAILPHNTPEFEAFCMALQKVSTSITSGWFREFCWEHYDEILAMYEPGITSQFWDAFNAGIVKPFKR